MRNNDTDGENRAVCLFVGSDVSSYFLAFMLAKRLLLRGHKVVIMLVQSQKRKTSVSSSILEDFLFFERTLLNQHILPMVENVYLLGDLSTKSLGMLKKRFSTDLSIIKIQDVNSTKTTELLRAYSVKVGLSLRCYQKFGQPILDYFAALEPNAQGALWNLHPGLLPQYRGVITFFRAMQNREKQAGFSLHYINSEWDAGAIIQSWPIPLDYTKSVLANMVQAAHTACSPVFSFIAEALDGRYPACSEQDESSAGYFSFPTDSELREAELTGVRLFWPEDLTNVYCNWFAPEPSDLRSELLASASEVIAENMLRSEDQLMAAQAG